MAEQNSKRVYFPILISLSDRKCLVIGGGPIARHKVQSLEKFSPQLTILAPEIDEKLAEIAVKNKFEIIRKEYKTADLEGFDLVIAATGKKKVSAQIWKDCKEKKILINAVDDPEHCDFILPATVKRGDLTVSVGTQGRSPFLTKELRRWMNRMFTPEWEEVIDLAADFRKQVFARYSAKQREERDDCFARFLEVDWAALLRDKRPEELTKLVAAILEGKKLKLENNGSGGE
ncbi:MAG TPA: bifunctional precorrin-2 dehydrogenase/sirohydrochlorin ferrochelatase [Bacteroidetes bacterium]|nr:bifunctional precorrin-2 dehydrogenase/sirohydrochlorin ferrochelatase [Bacteroidota bacterium]